jgi:seryl-tRNA synthetase
MHDKEFIRKEPAAFKAALARRGLEIDVEALLALDAADRGGKTEIQQLQAKANEIAKSIPVYKKEGKDIAPLLAEGKALKEKIAAMEKGEGGAFDDALTTIPNLLAADVPEGKDESANQEIRRVDVPPLIPPQAGGNQSKTSNLRHASSAVETGKESPPFTGGQGGNLPKDHVALGEALGMMDFEGAAKISGSRFVVLSGDLARLERALAAFMLDIHTSEFGYTETNPPFLVKDAALFGTGQLPKFAEDLFKTTGSHWLIPTSEVSLTNLVADSIIEANTLPRRYTAHTPCFRSEAGAAGKDTRGMIRQHQFSKVELVSITTPEQSEAEHERMLGCAEEVLKRLGLHYRVMLLCAGDTGFSARKTYDIEVWLPGQNLFREISSCSNCGDFQARRMKARYRKSEKEVAFVHTLNGSGLAVGRTLVAVLENYQQPDGSIAIPAALQPYMGGKKVIAK